MLDEKYWSNSSEFNPNRFLDDTGKYLSIKPNAYTPFSVGRRICPGENLILADVQLVLIRFLQLTDDYHIKLQTEKCLNNLEPDPVCPWLQFPKPYQIAFINNTDQSKNINCNNQLNVTIYLISITISR